MNPFRLPRSYPEGSQWGVFWMTYLSGAGFPLVALAFLFAARRGWWSHALDVLGVLLIVMVTSRSYFTVRNLKTVYDHTKVCPEANRPRCSAPCSCGCGHTIDTVPKRDCGKPCMCGCGRPCVVHEGHRGGCGS